MYFAYLSSFESISGASKKREDFKQYPKIQLFKAGWDRDADKISKPRIWVKREGQVQGFVTEEKFLTLTDKHLHIYDD